MSIFGLFKCKHPAAMLAVASSKPEVEPIDEDFDKVTLKLHCKWCGEPVSVSCAELRGGVDAFFERGRYSGRKEQG